MQGVDHLPAQRTEKNTGWRQQHSQGWYAPYLGRIEAGIPVGRGVAQRVHAGTHPLPKHLT
jgi:hypothetical protein